MEVKEQLQRTLGDDYTISRELSGGGMALVYVALERALGREIVVKVLPPDRAASVSAQRFQREIQLAARLQHPHIVPLLSAGDSNGLPYYTMPFVKGESLRARLARGGELSINDTLHILRDIVAALAYAHGEGVVHRDIKPDNVILTGGVAVVTDFGVAKAMDLAAVGAQDQAGITSLGVALGTPAYMSPEQASADPHVDHRSDIYSFGCLAYELLTGASPFAGRPTHQMLAAQVTDTPDPVQRRRPTIPPGLATLVMRCLEKRPGDRPQSATEVLSALDAIATPSGGAHPTDARIPAVQPQPRTWLMAVSVLMLVATAGAMWVLRKPATYSIGSTIPIAISPSVEWHPAISPDGRLVAYSAYTPQGMRIFVRQVDGGRPVMIANEPASDHDYPAWSPDGSRLLFTAGQGIWIAPALGGTPRLLTTPPSPERTRVFGMILRATWSPDGRSIAYSTDGIWVIPVEGGAPRQVLAGPWRHSPAWSSDGRYIAFVDGAPLSIGNISASSVWIAPTDSTDGPPVRVTPEGYLTERPVFTPDGRSLLYISSQGGPLDVYQQPLRSGRPRGEPIRLTTGLSAHVISISSDGTRLAHDVVRMQSNAATIPLGRTGVAKLTDARMITDENQIVEQLTVSPDGKWLAYDSNIRGNYDIYKVRTDGGDPIQLTNDPANDFSPAWSPDGREIAFHSNRATDGVRQIHVMSSDGANQRAITSGQEQKFVPRWSPDGSRIVYIVIGEGTRMEVVRRQGTTWAMVDTSDRLPQMDWPQATWSPDGTSLVAASNGDVILFDATQPRYPMRTIMTGRMLGDSAQAAVWSVDGTKLYVSAFGPNATMSIWEVPFAGGRVGRPRKLLGTDPYALYSAIIGVDARNLYFPRGRIDADVSVVELKR